jgi:hypothetical protein
VMEHELVHLIEMLLWEESSCSSWSAFAGTTGCSRPSMRRSSRPRGRSATSWAMPTVEGLHRCTLSARSMWIT